MSRGVLSHGQSSPLGMCACLRRYEALWLPLLKESPLDQRNKLVPPLDVAFVQVG